MLNKDGDEENVEFDDQAEYDYMLKEYAGDVLPSFALCLPEATFEKYFEKVLIYLLKILNNSESSPAEESFVIGVVGETVANLSNLNAKTAQKLYAGLIYIF